jgi:hypothetical protein
MKKLQKKAAPFPTLARIVRAISVFFKIRFSWAGNAKKIFTHHYSTNYWGSDESRSGYGSTAAYAANLITELPRLIDRLGVRSILDAPCGDYNWFRLVPREPGITYLGGDIVDPLVASNQAKYGDPSTQFRGIDIVRDPLPKVDLWLCRDCLFHLSNRDILQTIQNFLRSDIKYLLTSTHPECSANTDIPTGSFRLLNLELPPFSLGPPAYRIDDYIEGFPVRQVALWERATLAKTFLPPKEAR